MSRGYRLSFIAVLSGALQFVSALCSGRNAGEGFAGTWFRLMNNVDLNGHPWTPIGTGPAIDVSPSFCGTFDGDGNQVAGLFIPHATGLSGLFGFIGREGCVQNLHVTVPQIISSTGSNIVQGICAGRITDDNDGIDFVAKPFHTTPGPVGPFEGWSTTAWYFDPSNIRLPALRTTAGSLINSQPVLKRTDYAD